MLPPAQLQVEARRYTYRATREKFYRASIGLGRQLRRRLRTATKAIAYGQAVHARYERLKASVAAVEPQ